APIGGGPAERRSAVDERYEMRARPVETGNRPCVAVGLLCAIVDAGHDPALAAAQIGPEPCNHDRHTFDVRCHRLQLVHTGHKVGRGISTMSVLRSRLARAKTLHHGARRIAELGCSRDQRDSANHLLKPAYRTYHLERQLRDSIAEIRKWQSLEHDIRKATIG